MKEFFDLKALDRPIFERLKLQAESANWLLELIVWLYIFKVFSSIQFKNSNQIRIAF